MMKRILILPLLFFLFCTSVVYAKQISPHNVKTAVETWVRYVITDRKKDAVVQKLEPYVSEGEVIAYIAHFKGEGFCLCGADDLVLPVYFYSKEGIYDSNNPGLQYVLWEIEERTKSFRRGLKEKDPKLQQYKKALNERASFWQELIAGRIPERVIRNREKRDEPVKVELNVTSRWGQGDSKPGDVTYNLHCPTLSPDEHALLGCVSAALSQVLYYWKYPMVGEGQDQVTYKYRFDNWFNNKSLASDPNIPSGYPWIGRLWWGAGDLWMAGYWDESLYEEAKDISEDSNYRDVLEDLWNDLTRGEEEYSVDFSATTYGWNVMGDKWSGLTTEGKEAVATLCYHTGVALGMDYGIYYSGAYDADIDNAIEDHFRYDSDAHYTDRNIDTMTEEIQWFRPLIMGGERTTSGDKELGKGKVGHAWVVYGYDKSTDPDRLFKVNFGWEGYSDGWYSYDDMTYTIDQKHTVKIAPESVVRFVGANDGGDGTPNDAYENIEEALNEAPDGVTLIFKAGSYNSFSSDELIITKPLTLKGEDIIISK